MRKEANDYENSKGKFINSKEFKVGDTLKSKQWGDFIVLSFTDYFNIEIKFINTGNVYTRQKGEILRGAVSDRDVINSKVSKQKNIKQNKESFHSNFMEKWNPDTHITTTKKLPYFKTIANGFKEYAGFTYVDEYTYNKLKGCLLTKNAYVMFHLSKYNCQTIGVNKPKGKTVCYRLHSWVKAMPAGFKNMMTDHVNGLKLDNRNHNLRIADSSQNSANSRASSETGYKGIKILKASTKGRRIKNIRAQGWIPMSNKYKFLGKFYTIEEAAKAVDIWNIENYGEFARLNLNREIYEEMGLLPKIKKKCKLP